MTEIKSNEVIVKGPIEDVFNFLNDLNNLHQLLPQDKISNWESDENKCSFKIQNAATIDLIKEKTNSPDYINMKSGSKAPFPYTLEVFLSKENESDCKGFLLFKGEMNPFIKMVAEKPLSKLFDYMSNKLHEIRA